MPTNNTNRNNKNRKKMFNGITTVTQLTTETGWSDKYSSRNNSTRRYTRTVFIIGGIQRDEIYIFSNRNARFPTPDSNSTHRGFFFLIRLCLEDFFFSYLKNPPKYGFTIFFFVVKRFFIKKKFKISSGFQSEASCIFK